MEAFDFAPEFIDADIFLNEKYWRDVMTDGVWDTQNMSDEELDKAIVGDVLGVTMWEIQSKKTLSFDWNQLVLFVHVEKERFRIKEHLDSLIETNQITCTDGQLRIEVVRLQATMDYVGEWYTGYVMPNGKTIIATNRENFSEALESFGSIETMAKALSMEMESSVPSSSFVH